jgi:hypothetical protein
MWASPVGIGSKKSPPTTVARSAPPCAAANSSAAPSTMTGRSNSTPRIDGVACRMDASSGGRMTPVGLLINTGTRHRAGSPASRPSVVNALKG